MWADLQSANVLCEAGVLAICISVGWLRARAYNRQMLGRLPTNTTQALRIDGMQRRLSPQRGMRAINTDKMHKP